MATTFAMSIFFLLQGSNNLLISGFPHEAENTEGGNAYTSVTCDT